MKLSRVVALPLVLTLLAACSAKQSESAGGGALEAFYAATPPAAAKTVRELRASAKNGEEVVVVGRAKDFVGGLAALTLIDASKPACDEEGPMPDCPTPWDYCCNEPKDIAAVCTFVELRDSKGVVKQGLQGFHGLEHLDTVTVKGKLEIDDQGVPMVVAQSIAVTKRVKPAHQ